LNEKAWCKLSWSWWLDLVLSRSLQLSRSIWTLLFWADKEKNSFSKKIFSDQSEIIENKKIKSFLEKTNNSQMILKRTTSIESSKRLNERSERLNKRSERLIKRRMNESWRKKLKKIEISSSRILRKESKMNFFYDEIPSKFYEESTDEESTIEIHSITVVSFNILSRQKDVKIFFVFMKNLEI
jgi:hypothetical protein